MFSEIVDRVGALRLLHLGNRRKPVEIRAARADFVAVHTHDVKRGEADMNAWKSDMPWRRLASNWNH